MQALTPDPPAYVLVATALGREGRCNGASLNQGDGTLPQREMARFIKEQKATRSLTHCFKYTTTCLSQNNST